MQSHQIYYRVFNLFVMSLVVTLISVPRGFSQSLNQTEASGTAASGAAATSQSTAPASGTAATEKKALPTSRIDAAGQSAPAAPGTVSNALPATGLRVPDNLPQIARKQHRLAMRMSLSQSGARARFDQEHPLLAWVFREPMDCAGLPAFDWRKFGKTTPVRDQGNCGACWAFASTSALEASYILHRGEALHLSEQYLLNCSNDTNNNSCNSGYWAFDFLKTGDADEADLPYTGVQTPRASCGLKHPYKDVNWDFVDTGKGGIPEVSEMKKALCDHGPLAVGIKFTPELASYDGGIFNEHASGAVDHAVTLLGWDDSYGAWIVKNSWGPCWGDTAGWVSPGYDGSKCAADTHGLIREKNRGYAWIKFGSNSIGDGAAWVDAPFPSDPTP
jgi:cathepsin L